MPVYIVGQLRVEDWAWYRTYRSVTEPLVARHGGKYLIKGEPIAHLEGSGSTPSALVLIEFPSEQQARSWYQDPEYIPMIELRKSSGVDTELYLASAFED